MSVGTSEDEEGSGGGSGVKVAGTNSLTASKTASLTLRLPSGEGRCKTEWS